MNDGQSTERGGAAALRRIDELNAEIEKLKAEKTQRDLELARKHWYQQPAFLASLSVAVVQALVIPVLIYLLKASYESQSQVATRLLQLSKSLGTDEERFQTLRELTRNLDARYVAEYASAHPEIVLRVAKSIRDDPSRSTDWEYADILLVETLRAQTTYVSDLDSRVTRIWTDYEGVHNGLLGLASKCKSASEVDSTSKAIPDDEILSEMYDVRQSCRDIVARCNMYGDWISNGQKTQLAECLDEFEKGASLIRSGSYGNAARQFKLITLKVATYAARARKEWDELRNAFQECLTAIESVRLANRSDRLQHLTSARKSYQQVVDAAATRPCVASTTLESVCKAALEVIDTQ